MSSTALRPPAPKRQRVTSLFEGGLEQVAPRRATVHRQSAAVERLGRAQVPLAVVAASHDDRRAGGRALPGECQGAARHKGRGGGCSLDDGRAGTCCCPRALPLAVSATAGSTATAGSPEEDVVSTAGFDPAGRGLETSVLPTSMSTETLLLTTIIHPCTPGR